ncbi:MAG: HAD-IIA family hydrolase [Actinobacteria bacterium]|nr:HAD-IIA family hydrolase [Actinomycetota bacterium]
MVAHPGTSNHLRARVWDDDPVPDWVVDLDGVVWLGAEPVPGAAESLSGRLALGERVVFCTNNSSERGQDKAAALVSHGLPKGVEVVTSADAVARLVEPSWNVLCLGGPGLREALQSVGASVVDSAEADTGSFDAVVVGLDRQLDYHRIDNAARAVRNGARLFASNTDSTFPDTTGLRPGCGAIVAAVATASGSSPIVAGKPEEPMADLLRERLPRGGVVVGDRADTDGRLAERLGWPFVLVLSGVTRRSDLPVDVPTACIAEDLPAAVRTLDSWYPGSV